MKRDLVIALGLASVLALAACKKKEEAPVEPVAPAAETMAPSAESAPADTMAPAPSATETPKCPTEADPNAACPEAVPPPPAEGEKPKE